MQGRIAVLVFVSNGELVDWMYEFLSINSPESTIEYAQDPPSVLINEDFEGEREEHWQSFLVLFRHDEIPEEGSEWTHTIGELRRLLNLFFKPIHQFTEF